MRGLMSHGQTPRIDADAQQAFIRCVAFDRGANQSDQSPFMLGSEGLLYRILDDTGVAQCAEVRHTRSVEKAPSQSLAKMPVMAECNRRISAAHCTCIAAHCRRVKLPQSR
ncbi:hypothetical protein BURKHO8Y_40062 [Burkholderia sp. 8Y]|nr:hypothetical protein BURKHO8Y_40062 [Burkholderia sp. 8Y]